jgi:Na+-translocating ferredoxin:NAD+ oxidoreductase RNF subunit RnfB
MSSGLSRRALFSIFGRSLRGPVKAGQGAVEKVMGAEAGNDNPRGESQTAMEPEPKVAVIQGRFCLAYTSFCTVCSERCPVPGAIRVEKGIPVVVAETCTGCGVCHEVCPAPRNAVLVLPRRRSGRALPPAPPSNRF